MKKLKIGIDLDNTINASALTVNFFSLITKSLSDFADIYIITNRDTSEESRKEIILELERYDIHYDKLVITANKHDYIIENDITVYIDDTDEYFQKLPSSVLVFKIREPGNFDFDQNKWIYGDKTGINIDQK